jgi:hypothetical protein
MTPLERSAIQVCDQLCTLGFERKEAEYFTEVYGYLSVGEALQIVDTQGMQDSPRILANTAAYMHDIFVLCFVEGLSAAMVIKLFLHEWKGRQQPPTAMQIQRLTQ